LADRTQAWVAVSACGDRLLGAAVVGRPTISERSNQPLETSEGPVRGFPSGPLPGRWDLILVAAPGTPMGDSGLVTALQQAGRGRP
jgi:hypothetical protein